MTEENIEVLNQLFGNEEKTEKDEIVCVVDRSGSMGSICSDAEGGLNAFIEEQKDVEGGANLTLVEFDTAYNVVYDRIDINEAAPYTLKPRGSTALLDAIGQAINTVADTNGKKIIVIVTDGGENSSKEYTKDQITSLITEKQDQGWEFIFLAANQDAIAVAGDYGIDTRNAVNFAATGDGAQEGYAAVATYTTSLRTKSKLDALNDLESIKAVFDNIS